MKLAPEPDDGDDRIDEANLPGPFDVVRLTPKGLKFYEDLLRAFSAEAGCPIDGDDVRVIMDRVKAELNIQELFFKDRATLDCFIKHLRNYRSTPI